MIPYSINFAGFSMASAAQELFTIAPADDAIVELLEFGLWADAATSVAQCRVGLRRMTGTITAGSGGASATPVCDWNPALSAAATCRVNDTTLATQTGGADTLMLPFAFNALNALVWLPAPEYRPRFRQGELLVLRALTGFGSTTTISGYLKFREL
jgi:hypothetical protein